MSGRPWGPRARATRRQGPSGLGVGARRCGSGARARGDGQRGEAELVMERRGIRPRPEARLTGGSARGGAAPKFQRHGTCRLAWGTRRAPFPAARAVQDLVLPRGRSVIDGEPAALLRVSARLPALAGLANAHPRTSAPRRVTPGPAPRYFPVRRSGLPRRPGATAQFSRDRGARSSVGRRASLSGSLR
jgi:hypothetical protein